ncbi:hypothetical protein [Cellulophaga sp. Hel_I_12]|uniref:hypothetical protein n=1 Tax=Cellulophaga sp. Hel_I_12 TaxID=1249972 RepID=UPI000647C5A8|nr:hypothetical protein [Cellulophaga sp. Hel_I_12]
MTKKYIYTISLLWSFLLSTTIHAKHYTSRAERPVLSEAKVSRSVEWGLRGMLYTVSTTPTDSVKVKKTNTSQLTYLQQLNKVYSRSSATTSTALPIGSPTSASSAHRLKETIIDVNNSPLETVKRHRTFPSLQENQNLTTGQSGFNFPLATRKPEFTEKYIAANFSKNPKVDTLVAQAKKAFDQLKKLGNFVDIITGKELLELPVGLRKKDSTSQNSVELAIVEVKFTPQYAEFKAWGKLSIPQKGPNGEPQRELYFGAEGIKLSHDGALLGDMKLVLLGDQAIPMQGDNWLLTLKGGINLETGVFGDQSYIEFDCAGLKGIGLEGDLRISRQVLLPITSGGNYTCGDKIENKYLKDQEGVVNNKCYVGTSFSVQANGWNDILLEVSLPKFEVVGLKGWGFNVQRAVLDLSDTKNASGIKFPEEYKSLYNNATRKLWRGFYAKEISITLPKGIENTKTSDGRVQFGAEHLIIDSQGVSGTFYGENVLNKGDGTAGKWAFSVSDVSISLAMNAVTGGAMAGEIAVPILKEAMEYEGYIAATGWGLEVGRKSNYQAPVFLGEIFLERNSKIGIDVKDGNVYPFAHLTGQLSVVGKINQKEGEEPPTPEDIANDTKGFSFPGIVFEELALETEPGKKPISAKSFGFTGDMKLMGFPASVSKLALVTPANELGLSFDLSINLDGDGSHATTSMNIIGKLDEGAKIQEWKFKSVKIEGIEIDYKKSGIALKGSLEIMEDHSWYGDGFRGDLTATIKDLDFTAKGKAIFGNKDFRYWNIDIWTEDNTSPQKNKLLITAFAGGISYKMKKSRGNNDGFSPSSAVYRPNIDYGLGVRAGVAISAQNKSAFNGRAYLDMEFNTHGGLNRIGFTGQGTFMSDYESGFSSGTEGMGALEKTLEKVEGFIEKNEAKIAKLMKDGNYMEVAQEAIPQSDVADKGSIGVYVGIEKDFVNNTFDGEFELYLDLEGIRGGGANNLAGYAKMHTSPEDWYIYIGTPQQRISLVFSIQAFEVEVGGYFMTGTKLPSQLDPHPQVVKILGSDMLNNNRRENQLQAAKGFAFGLNFIYRQNYSFAIFYASLEAGAGFDVMHAYYPDAKCVGRPGPIGNDGWYSMGQVYAYLYGEFGVQVNLVFIKGKFQIAEAGVAAMLRGQFPNPLYIQGYVGMYYNILGGLVSGRMRLKVEMGEECELENINNAVGVPMISDVTPADKSDDVSVFAAPQAVFNYAANQSFDVELDEGKRTFKLQLKNFTATSEGKTLAGALEWNDTNDAVTFKPAETLPSEKEIQLVVEVSFDEKIGGNFQTMVENGKPVVEKKEVVFITDKAPDHIPLENIVYMYPVLEQQSFYPEEFDKGYVKMKTPQHYLFESGYEMRAEFANINTGLAIRSNLSYDRSKATIFYEVPDMMLNVPYTLNLIAFPPGTEIQQEVTIVKEDVFTDAESGDTNWFDVASNTQNKETVNTSGSAVVASKKANNVILANGAPKSILAYSFKTSKHESFKDKIRDLSVVDNLTNFIYADVHSLSIKVADYEYLDKLEVLGGKYTESIPLVYAQAILDDQYYKRIIYPLLYENYPLDGDIRVNREEELLGIPPIRSFYVGNEYLANLENNPNSPWVKNRIPFVYNMPYQYKSDMVYLRNRIVNRYNSTQGDPVKYEAYKYLLQSSFPPLPLGSFKAQLIYRTPGNLYQKGYELKYKND